MRIVIKDKNMVGMIIKFLLYKIQYCGGYWNKFLFFIIMLIINIIKVVVMFFIVFELFFRIDCMEVNIFVNDILFEIFS